MTQVIQDICGILCIQVALSNKRKTIKFSDVVQATAKDRRWEAAGLKDVLMNDDMFEDARTGRVAAPCKAPEQDPKARQITAFFKA